jgi:hypothetical protein
MSNESRISGFDDCVHVAEEAHHLWLRTFGPAGTSAVASRLRVFEEGFSRLLLTELRTHKLRELRACAKVLLVEVDRDRERFRREGCGQLEVTERKLSQFVEDTEAISSALDLAEEGLTKLERARSLLNGEPGNAARKEGL